MIEGLGRGAGQETFKTFPGILKVTAQTVSNQLSGPFIGNQFALKNILQSHKHMIIGATAGGAEGIILRGLLGTIATILILANRILFGFNSVEL